VAAAVDTALALEEGSALEAEEDHMQVEGTGAANSLDSLAAPAPHRPDSTVQPTSCESETGSGTDVTRRKGAVARFNGRFLVVWGMAMGNLAMPRVWWLVVEERVAAENLSTKEGCEATETKPANKYV